jgi:hypothetical protein
MTMFKRVYQSLPQPRPGWAAFIGFLLLCGLVACGSEAWKFGQPVIGRSFPEWAWRHGTAEMQRFAAQTLIFRIQTGMSFPEVLEILGPDSAGWPRLKTHQLQFDGAVGFKVRAGINNGIDVGFRNGRVVSVFYYD